MSLPSPAARDTMVGVQKRTVLIPLFDGVQSLDFTGPLEVLHGSGGYDVTTAGLDGRPVRTSSGLLVTPDTDLASAAPPHTLLVPGGQGTRTPHPELVAWLRAADPATTRTVSVCSGALLLAEAGLLDGRRATTHWNVCATLARRFPAVTVDPDPIFVRDGKYATSAGVSSGIDLALALVEEDLGRERALAVARHLVVFLRRPGGQAQFSAQLAAQTAARAPIRDLQQWITEHPAADLRVEALAARTDLSPRQFARVFAEETGVTPGQYVDQVRLEAARRLLEASGASRTGVDQVARACGYGTTEALRRAFARTLGVTPTDYRDRFSLSYAPSRPES